MALALERQDRREEARQAARTSCETSRLGCFFYVDLDQSREALHLACSKGLVACKEYWGNDEVSLIEAASAGDLARVQVLLAKGVNVNAGGGNLPSPLQAATMAGSDAIAEQLVAHGARVDGPEEETIYQSPLFYAISLGDERMALFLIERGAAFRHVPHENGLMLEAAIQGERRVVHKMLALGMPPDEDTLPVGSSLTVAVKNRDLEMVKDLLKHGADPNYDNKHSGGTPIDWARQVHDDTILRLLLGIEKNDG